MHRNRTRGKGCGLERGNLRSGIMKTCPQLLVTGMDCTETLWISIVGDGQNPTEHSTGKSALADPPVVMELGLWEVPARLSCSVVLRTVLIVRL